MNFYAALNIFFPDDLKLFIVRRKEKKTHFLNLEHMTAQHTGPRAGAKPRPPSNHGAGHPKR